MTADRRSYWDSPSLNRLSLLPCDGLHSLTPNAQPCGVVSPLQVALESHTTVFGRNTARFATSRIVYSCTPLDLPTTTSTISTPPSTPGIGPSGLMGWDS